MNVKRKSMKTEDQNTGKISKEMAGLKVKIDKKERTTSFNQPISLTTENLNVKNNEAVGKSKDYYQLETNVCLTSFRIYPSGDLLKNPIHTYTLNQL